MTQLKTVLEIEGYKIEFDFIKGCPATNNDFKLSELINEEATKLRFDCILSKSKSWRGGFLVFPGAYQRCNV